MMINKKILIFSLFVIFFSLYISVEIRDGSLASEFLDKINSEINCPCCDKNIAECECGHAKEMKTYIEGLSDAGLDKEKILTKVAKKYSLESIIDKSLRKKIETKLIRQAGSSRPQIFIKPLSYNLGEVSKSKGKLKLFVRLKNKGNEILTINNLKTSCGCTTVKLRTKQGMSPSFSMEDKEVDWKINLAPGEEGKLIITTDLNHPHVKVGHLLRTVQIESNDPVHPVTTIEFEAEIVE